MLSNIGLSFTAREKFLNEFRLFPIKNLEPKLELELEPDLELELIPELEPAPKPKFRKVLLKLREELLNETLNEEANINEEIFRNYIQNEKPSILLKDLS